MEDIEINVFKDDILNTIREPIIVLNSKLEVIYANSSYCKTFKTSFDKIKDISIYNIGDGQWNIQELRNLLDEILPKKTSFEDFRIQHIFPTIGNRIMLLNARQLEDGKRKEKFIVLAIEDITEKTKIFEASLHANKLSMIGQLSAGIAHGLSSPLTGIHNFLDIYM